MGLLLEDEFQTALSEVDREWLRMVCGCTDLTGLTTALEADLVHDAYFAAKDRWRDIHERHLESHFETDGLPGVSVTVGEQTYEIHGITHGNTDEERTLLHEHVPAYLDAGDQVYCEEGIWSMYFRAFPDVCESDDYRWAVTHSSEESDSSLVDTTNSELEDVAESTAEVIEQLRESTFSLIDSGSEVYGDRLARVIGDVASSLLMSHEQFATAESFRSFQLSQIASKHPKRLVNLQRYYHAAFLPQPLEREWLRRHDPELEWVTHARNERIADYGVYHSTAPRVHIIVGAAHQPGVRYYLTQHRDGHRDVSEFELVD